MAVMVPRMGMLITLLMLRVLLKIQLASPSWILGDCTHDIAVIGGREQPVTHSQRQKRDHIGIDQPTRRTRILICFTPLLSLYRAPVAPTSPCAANGLCTAAEAHTALAIQVTIRGHVAPLAADTRCGPMCPKQLSWMSRI